MKRTAKKVLAMLIALLMALPAYGPADEAVWSAGTSEASDCPVGDSAEVTIEAAESKEIPLGEPDTATGDMPEAQPGGEPDAELPFAQQMCVDGVTIAVTAKAGVFPAGAWLQVSRAEDAAVAEAVAAEDGAAGTYTHRQYRIEVLDAAGNVIVPDAAQGAPVVRVTGLGLSADARVAWYDEYAHCAHPIGAAPDPDGDAIRFELADSAIYDIYTVEPLPHQDEEPAGDEVQTSAQARVAEAGADSEDASGEALAGDLVNTSEEAPAGNAEEDPDDASEEDPAGEAGAEPDDKSEEAPFGEAGADPIDTTEEKPAGEDSAIPADAAENAGAGDAGTIPAEDGAESTVAPAEEGAEASPSEDADARSSDLPGFSQSRTVSGVTVTVMAAPGVFPEGAVLSVSRVPVYRQREASAAIEAVRGEDANVAVSYTFDIRVIDPETGEELQPADGQAVAVSFALARAADDNLETSVYHVTGEDGELTATRLESDVDAASETVTATTDGFSLYTVEFTYDSLEYVMQGGAVVALDGILREVGLTGEAENVAVSDERLFSASKESGQWLVASHQPFDSVEWMKVTIDGVTYKITVTDDTTLEPVYYIDAAGARQGPVTDYTLVTSSTTEWRSGWYVARGTVQINNSVNVRSTGVNLILCDGAILKTPWGIAVNKDTSLTVWAQNRNAGTRGELVADCSQIRRSGIGGSGADTGAITINGGSVSGLGGRYAAGIGGDKGHSGGTITVNGGALYGVGGDEGAGIGGGGIIVINGGYVSGIGGYGGGAGIGGGGGYAHQAPVNPDRGGAGTITISGGIVYASGGENGAASGIGYGEGCNECESTIRLTYSDSDPSTTVESSGYGGTLTLEKCFTNTRRNTNHEGTISSGYMDLFNNSRLVPRDAYLIYVLHSDQGGISADRQMAFSGDTVALSVTPALGYIFSAWKVILRENPSQSVTVTGNTFTMPGAEVQVAAVFETAGVITLKAGEGSGGDIFISSGDPANQAQTSAPGKFYADGDGEFFCCPENPFAAPAGKAFGGWLAVTERFWTPVPPLKRARAR